MFFPIDFIVPTVVNRQGNHSLDYISGSIRAQFEPPPKTVICTIISYSPSLSFIHLSTDAKGKQPWLMLIPAERLSWWALGHRRWVQCPENLWTDDSRFFGSSRFALELRCCHVMPRWSRGEDCGKFWNCYQVYQSSFGKLRRFSSLSFGSTAVMSSWKVWAAGLIYGCGAVAWPKGTGCWANWSQTKTIYDAIWTIYDGLLLIG